eukprot:TRINITY_DN767_c0_g4_i1.p1 TRINITY_DN767_c0_g4~~TRINITY_DN767_c0_g4_i1.p1  ORF type:complete len:1345 (+),score=416.40 TRINITY_DN767_c0_g4_i1:92-4126(+)
MAVDSKAAYGAQPPPVEPPATQQCTRRSPFFDTWKVGKWWYLYLNPLLAEGFSRTLTKDDLYEALPDEKAEAAAAELKEHWDGELTQAAHEGREPSLLKTLVRGYGCKYFMVTCIGLAEYTCGMLEPLFAGYLLDAMLITEEPSNATLLENTTLFANATQTPPESADTGGMWLWASLFMLVAFIRSVMHHPFFGQSQQLGMKLRIACTSLIYGKILRLTGSSVMQTTTGHLVNLISNDTERFDQSAIFLHFLLIGPLKAVVTMYVAVVNFSYAGAIGITLVLCMAPLQYNIGKRFGALRRETTQCTDKRVKVMNEVIQGIRLIKMYAWEIPFSKAIAALRLNEEQNLRRTARLRAFNASVFFLMTPLVMFIILTIWVWTDGRDEDLKPSQVFTTMMYINILRFSFGMFIPQAVAIGSEALVSVARIEKMLLLEEHKTGAAGSLALLSSTEPINDDVEVPSAPVPAPLRLDPSTAIKVDKVSATWPTGTVPVFEDAALEVRKGELVGVMGLVGCGKTSLLSLLTGELRAAEGSGGVGVAAPPSLAAQEVWIISGTVRDNILLGRELDEARYNAVVAACGLLPDFEQLADGDTTLVGERGITLSGGQKARLSLARTCYEGGDIVLLDDPLSAVDTHVGRHIFDRCITGLLQNTTRVLVTHQHQYLPQCDRVYIVKDKKFVLATDEDFAGIIDSPPTGPEGEPAEMAVPKAAKQVNRESQAADAAAGKEDGKGKKEKEKEMAAEDRNIGAVSVSTFLTYFSLGGRTLAIVFVFLALGAQVGFAWMDLWLARWVDIPGHENQERAYRYRTYAWLFGITLVLGVARSFLFFHMAINASTRLHNRMFTAVLNSPVSFLDTNPSGRVLNRFAADLGRVDELLPWIFFDFQSILLSCVGLLVTVSIVNPWVIIAVVPVVCVFIGLRQYYIQTAREVKRMEAMAKGPIFSIFSECLNGLECIRAFRRQDWFSARFRAAQDDHTSAFHVFLTANRWIGFRLDLMSWFFICCVTVAAVVVTDAGGSSLSNGEIALSLAYVSVLTGSAQWCVRQSAETESLMTAVERIRAYGDLPPQITDTPQSPRDSWPEQGQIRFKNYSMRYREGLPLVVKALDLVIPPKSKIGIVGRTGAGKSSIMQALFRLCEPAEGLVEIDGLDTATIPLADLRSRCSVIPQDPVLFTGTLRYNLDPFDTVSSDEALWAVLEEVQLRDLITASDKQLDMVIHEGGKNFSVGQRQLICLARALIRRNKILMMDEATANVDPNTDRVIQDVVREKFADCTVLTIAHRLHTVIDCDKVLVLDQGVNCGYDDPHVLLSDSESLLSSFVDQTGPEASAALRETAKEAHLKRAGAAA